MAPRRILIPDSGIATLAGQFVTLGTGVYMEQTRSKNRLLEVLPGASRERLIAAARYVELPLAAELFRRDERPRFVHFLSAGIGSVVFVSQGGTSVELATEGPEGLIGWTYLLGPGLSQGDCTMQVPGAGYRIPLAAVQREFDDSAETRLRILEYAQHQGIFANQIVACNRLHRAEARFARWLLGVSDRIGTNEINMTQEFMSTMLGTRRTTVAEVCADLARNGATESRRGGLRIVNRAALESHACECYGILRAHFDGLYMEPPRVSGQPHTNGAPLPPRVLHRA